VINTLRIYEELSQALEPKAAQKLASVLGMIYEDLQQTVTKAEFNELRQVVRELAEAQKRTEIRVEELAEAQKRTEARVEQLAEAQKRTEARLDQLTERVNQLAEAQQHTEKQLAELAAAQVRTEQALAQLTVRVDQLTVRMDQLVQRVDHLDRRLDDTNRQLGGLTATVGYTLENEAYRALPALLERDHGVVLTEPLRRGWLTDARGRDLEVNILGRGTRAGEEVWVLGESKSQLSANEVDRFLQQRVAALQPVLGKVFPVLVAHMVTSKEVPEYAREHGVALYFSYQFQVGTATR
jgi:phage shock protein A